MLEEDGCAFASRFKGILVFTVEDPAKAAIAEEANDGFNRGIDGRGNASADFPADRIAKSADASANLMEDASDGIGDQEEDRDLAESALNLIEAFFDATSRQFVLGNAFGHHGNLRRLDGVKEEDAEGNHEKHTSDKAKYKTNEPQIANGIRDGESSKRPTYNDGHSNEADAEFDE